MNAVAPGRPDDFNEQPTQHAKYGKGGSPPPAAEPAPPSTVDPDPVAPPTPPPAPEQFEPPEFLDPLDDEAEFTPWYRKPVVLIGWGLFVAILIGLIVYGIIELIHGGHGTGNNPSTGTTVPSTSTSTAPSQSSSPSPSTTTTAPPTSSAVQPPAWQPTQQQPTQQQPTHRHHFPQLPSVITIPEVPTVITVPPELR